jgi:hypothetical protein
LTFQSRSKVCVIDANTTRRWLDRERGLGVEVGGECDEQCGDGCGDECALGFGVVASEHDFYLLIVWKLSLRVLFTSATAFDDFVGNRSA